jgi:dihydrodipicolinate synthase/N-acetylneuraminate lyase
MIFPDGHNLISTMPGGMVYRKERTMKDMVECRERLRGIFNITVTPFTAQGDIDLAGLTANIERVIELGYDGILIGGTYGEFPTLSIEERAAIFRHVMQVAGDHLPVMLCSASSDPRAVRELTTLASELGGLPMVTPPFVSEVTNQQIIDFFKQMAPLSKTGILIYNAPGIGITLAPSLLEQLADIPQVVGIKQGDLNPTAIDQIANRLSGRLRLFCASDLAFLGPMMCGFDGISSTNSGVLPELILASFRALEQGDASTARELHRLWYNFRALARRHGQPQLVKAAMNLRGFNGGHVRSPLIDVSAETIEETRAELSRLAADPRSGVTLPA